MNNILKRCTGQVKLNMNKDITFFGCPEEANPVSLYGQIEIPHNLLKDLCDKNVILRLNGFAKVFWDEECSYFAIMASRKRLLWQEQSLNICPGVTEYTPPIDIDNSDKSNRSYHHSFPFHFTVEGHLPSSFGQFNDCIQYSVDLILLYDHPISRGQVEQREEIIASKPFLVRRCILPTMLPSLLTGAFNTPYTADVSTRSSSPELPETHTASSNEIIPENFITSPHLRPIMGDPHLSEKWVGIFEGISYCVVSPSCMIMGDKELTFKLLLSNKACPSTTSAYLTASLKQVVSCQINESENELIAGRMFSKVQPTSISKTNNNQRIILDSKEETALQVRLPLSDKLFEDLDCELIRVSHHIKIKLKFSRFSKRKLELNFPIVVTSLQDLPPPYES